jgi:hypothetical protein
MSSSDGIVVAASLPAHAAAGQVKPIVVLSPIVLRRPSG